MFYLRRTSAPILRASLANVMAKVYDNPFVSTVMWRLILDIFLLA